MKHIILSSIFVLFNLSSFAQFMPVLDADSTTFEIGVEVPDATVPAEIHISGDTIINDQVYKKVWVDSEFDDGSIELVGFTREDISEGKLWFKRVADMTESLIMDLSLEVGDTFLLNEANYCQYSPDIQDMFVSNIDTVDGRKIIDLDCFSTGYDSLRFIEGIGPNTTIFFQTFDLTEIGSLFYFNYGYTLCRMLKNDTIFYPEDGMQLCDFFSPTIDFNQVENITIFPNPTTSIINIEPIEQIKSISLHNTSGVLLLSKKKDFTQVDISKLPKGIYILKIKLKSGQIIVKKTIKQ